MTGLRITHRRSVDARILTTDQVLTAGLDAFMTPVEVVQTIIRIEQPYLPRVLHDPGAGEGAWVTMLHDAGYVCTAADIYDYGKLPGMCIEDYLTAPARPGFGAIVCNPPFAPALAWARKALTEAPYVAFLL